jgi:hypothetical protein
MIKKHFKNIDNKLEERLVDQIKAGKLEGEQWFRNPLGWLLVCFNNPLNFKNPNSELVVLQNNQKSISKYIKDYNQVHYGVGVGETELEFVRFELEQSGLVNLEAVDVNKTFLELFAENLKDKSFEFGDNSVKAELTQDLFQNYKISIKGRTLHLCLGGTLGNFDNSSKELWDIFAKNIKSEDLLIVGVKTNKYFDIDIKKYQTNHYYPTFVLSHIKEINPKLISWKSDKNGYIRMSYDSVEVFRTRRYADSQLESEAEVYGFEIVDSWICEYGHSKVVLFKRK